MAQYDFVIIGSGMGGLVCAYLLADHGHSVCVLEKNQQLGGSLQVFSREKTLFDTGVHYIGGLADGEPLHRIFRYLGLMDGVKWQRMDPHHDRISFDGDAQEYHHAQGIEAFQQALNNQFPTEQPAIAQYIEMVERMLANFPIDHLEYANVEHLDDALLALNAQEFIASITDNEKLRAVLGGASMLHAGGPRLPMYVHALVTAGYMRSAHKCVDGGSQIAKVLAHGIRARGGVVLSRKKVIGFEMDGEQIRAALTEDGERVEGRTFISNLHPQLTYDLVGRHHIKPSTYNRAARLPHTVSSFNVHVVCKPESFPYLNHNHYHFANTDVWKPHGTTDANWPHTYMLSTPATSRSPHWAEGISIMTYCNADEFAEWNQTHNCIVDPGHRDQAYHQFKLQLADRLLAKVTERFPHLLGCIQSIHTTTPLTFRDFIGNTDGALYGYEKDYRFPFRGFMSPATRIANLYLTGQHVHLHGIMGVTISALVTCSAFIDRKLMLERIRTV